MSYPCPKVWVSADLAAWLGEPQAYLSGAGALLAAGVREITRVMLRDS